MDKHFWHPGDPLQIQPIKVERIPIPIEEFKALCDLTLELTRLRQNECKHLSVENIGPEIMHNLLRAVYPPPMLQVSATTAQENK